MRTVDLKDEGDVVDTAADSLRRKDLAITPLSKEFLDGLGRMLHSRSPQFRKAYRIGELVSADEYGYLAIDPSFAEEVFTSQFFDLLEEWLNQGELPPKGKLLEKFKAAEILRADSPLEKSGFGRFPRILARRKRREFLNTLAECFPICFDSFNTQKPRSIMPSQELPAQEPKQSGAAFPSSKREQTKPYRDLGLHYSWKSPKRIRVPSRKDTETHQELSLMLERVLFELLEKTGPRELGTSQTNPRQSW